MRSKKPSHPIVSSDPSYTLSPTFCTTWYIVAFLLHYAATNYFHLLPYNLSYIAWPLYWIYQGCNLIGVWVIAHECGHHAFSDYQWLDDTIGLLLHSTLLVPYISWKYSHRRHHSNTGSLDHDEVFVPKLKSSMKWYSIYLNNPPGRILVLIVQLTLGWPLYLMFNASGRAYDRFACHFDPNSPIYTDCERLQIFISDAVYLLHSMEFTVLWQQKDLLGFMDVPYSLWTDSSYWSHICSTHTLHCLIMTTQNEIGWEVLLLQWIEITEFSTRYSIKSRTHMWHIICSQLWHTIMQWKRQKL